MNSPLLSKIEYLYFVSTISLNHSIVTTKRTAEKIDQQEGKTVLSIFLTRSSFYVKPPTSV